MKAHDIDSADNARISYEMNDDSAQVNSYRDVFHLDTHSGQLSVITTTALLSQTIIDQQYIVYVTATDHGTPPRSSTASLKVVVGDAAAQRAMTSRVGVSVYVTSAVCVGCFLVAAFLLAVAVIRRRRRHDNHHHHHHHHHERLAGSSASFLQQETAHILASCVTDKPRPLHDLDVTSDLATDDLPIRRLQVTTPHYTLCYEVNKLR